jgi:hypothetical protein
MGGQYHTPDALIRKRDLVPVVQKTGCEPGPVWRGKENLAPTAIRSPNRPACSQSLYLLRQPGPYVFQDAPQTINSLYISPLFHSKRLPSLSKYAVYVFVPLKWIRQFVANAATLNPHLHLQHGAVPPDSDFEREDAEFGGQSLNPSKIGKRVALQMYIQRISDKNVIQLSTFYVLLTVHPCIIL